VVNDAGKALEAKKNKSLASISKQHTISWQMTHGMLSFRKKAERCALPSFY